jgi:hypothetical protein
MHTQPQAASSSTAMHTQPQAASSSTAMHTPFTCYTCYRHSCHIKYAFAFINFSSFAIYSRILLLHQLQYIHNIRATHVSDIEMKYAFAFISFLPFLTSQDMADNDFDFSCTGSKSLSLPQARQHRRKLMNMGLSCAVRSMHWRTEGCRIEPISNSESTFRSVLLLAEFSTARGSSM